MKKLVLSTIAGMVILGSSGTFAENRETVNPPDVVKDIERVVNSDTQNYIRTLGSDAETALLLKIVIEEGRQNERLFEISHLLKMQLAQIEMTNVLLSRLNESKEGRA